MSNFVRTGVTCEDCDQACGTSNSGVHVSLSMSGSGARGGGTSGRRERSGSERANAYTARNDGGGGERSSVQPPGHPFTPARAPQAAQESEASVPAIRTFEHPGPSREQGTPSGGGDHCRDGETGQLYRETKCSAIPLLLDSTLRQTQEIEVGIEFGVPVRIQLDTQSHLDWPQQALLHELGRKSVSLPAEHGGLLTAPHLTSMRVHSDPVDRSEAPPTPFNLVEAPYSPEINSHGREQTSDSIRPHPASAYGSRVTTAGAGNGHLQERGCDSSASQLTASDHDDSQEPPMPSVVEHRLRNEPKGPTRVPPNTSQPPPPVNFIPRRPSPSCSQTVFLASGPQLPIWRLPPPVVQLPATLNCGAVGTPVVPLANCPPNVTASYVPSERPLLDWSPPRAVQETQARPRGSDICMGISVHVARVEPRAVPIEIVEDDHSCGASLLPHPLWPFNQPCEAVHHQDVEEDVGFPRQEAIADVRTSAWVGHRKVIRFRPLPTVPPNVIIR